MAPRETRLRASELLAERAAGKPMAAPEDSAIVAGMVLSVLTGVTRSPGMPAIEHMTDVTPRDVSRETGASVAVQHEEQNGTDTIYGDGDSYAAPHI